MKIMLAFSKGGHYQELKQIIEAFEGNDLVYATTYAASTKNLKNVYFIKDSAEGLIKNNILNIYTSLKIILKERPEVIVSTGADITIPICYIGKLFGSKVIFIESYCRVVDISATGKILYPISDLFLVQWKQLLNKCGKKAKYWGEVI